MKINNKLKKCWYCGKRKPAYKYKCQGGRSEICNDCRIRNKEFK